MAIAHQHFYYLYLLDLLGIMHVAVIELRRRSLFSNLTDGLTSIWMAAMFGWVVGATAGWVGGCWVGGWLAADGVHQRGPEVRCTCGSQ